MVDASEYKRGRRRAEEAFQKSLAEAEKLVGDTGDDLQSRTYLSMGLERLAEHLLERSENYTNPQAMKLLERKLSVDREIVQHDIYNDRSHRDYSIAHESLAVAHWLQGNLPAARPHLREMLSIREGLFARVPNDAETHEDYLMALLIFGRCEHGSDDLRGKAGYAELERLGEGLRYACSTGKVAIPNRHVALDETKPTGELLYSSARALTYCVQALQSDRIGGLRTGMYADTANQTKLLLAALECLREYRHDERFDVEHVRDSFARTPLGGRPEFVRFLSENP